MGIKALTHRDDGTEIVVPLSTEDWRPWVSAGRTRNWMLRDPLLDWLQLYGKSRNFVPSQELSDYDRNLDFLEFIFEKGKDFEAGILRLLQRHYQVDILAADYREILSLRKAEETFAAMQSGVPVIHQGVLWDAHNRNYGAPDFLVRSDVLREMFPEQLTKTEASLSAPDLGNQGWHYRVVDTKFTTLHLNANGEVGNDGSGPAYKAQPTTGTMARPTSWFAATCCGRCSLSNSPRLKPAFLRRTWVTRVGTTVWWILSSPPCT